MSSLTPVISDMDRRTMAIVHGSHHALDLTTVGTWLREQLHSPLYIQRKDILLGLQRLCCLKSF